MRNLEVYETESVNGAGLIGEIVDTINEVIAFGKGFVKGLDEANRVTGMYE